jgi:sialic acid synthase SpsE
MSTISDMTKNKPYFIADIAANHDGDIHRAFRLIELAKAAGADAAKFQNFTASKIVSKIEFDKQEKLTHQSTWNKSVYEVYEEASINKEWTTLLKKKCDSVGIEYMSTPYDFESLELIAPHSKAIKIGSGDITWHAFIEKVAMTQLEVIISTGASNIEEVKSAYEVVNKHNNNIIIMQCNTNYTAKIDNFKYINLNVLKSFKDLFPNAILGLSDHTSGHATVLGAIALGARVIEKHFTDDNKRQGPDHFFSMDPHSWREMVDRSLELWAALGDGVKKVEDNELESNLIQRRGTYAIRDLSTGQILEIEDLEFLRPISKDGIPPKDFQSIQGVSLKKDISKGSQILWTDLNL